MSFDEMDFEQELKNALTRKEPAKGFAERVIQQVEIAHDARGRERFEAVGPGCAGGAAGGGCQSDRAAGLDSSGTRSIARVNAPRTN